MFWKKKQTVEIETTEDEEEDNGGFFSTEVSSPNNTRMARARRLETQMRKSFQRTAADFTPIIPDGYAMDEAESVAMDSIKGSAKNFMARSYGGVPDAQLGWYAGQGFIGYQICAMLAQNWLISKACGLPGRDAIRNGFEITVNDGTTVSPKVLDQMRALDKKYKLNHNLRQFVKFGRIFGIRHALFKVESDDPEYYEKPFNIDGVKPGSYKGIVQIDPYWISPELDMESASNPGSMHFYEPTWWNLNGRRIHRTHLVIMIGDEVADVLKPSYLYGGISVPQKIYERVYAAERTANEAPMLTMTKRLNVRKINLEKATANPRQFEQKVLDQNYWRDNYGQMFIGLDETAEQLETALNDLDAVIMTQYQLVAAGADVPATKLLGTTPKGFNATGEYEEASYHEELESLQAHDLTPLIERHHELIIKSELAPSKPFGTTVTWASLDSMTAEEQANVNKTKSETAANLSLVGAIDGADERQRLINDPDSGYNGMPEEVPEDPLDEGAEGNDNPNPDEIEAMDTNEISFSTSDGQLGDAHLVTSQEYLNQDIVNKKILDRDFDVQVSPEFQHNGRPMRVILDGHHSLAAAIKAGVEPKFVEQTGEDDKKVYALGIDSKTFLRAADSGTGKFFNFITKGEVWRNS